MDDPGSIILKVVLLFALILVNAFFAMSEMAIVTLNDSKMEKMADEGHKKAKKVLRLTEDSSRFLSTIQVGVTLAGFLTSAVAATSFSSILTAWLTDVFSITDGSVKGLIASFSLILITIVISYFSLVLGELLPKRIAMHNPESISFRVVGILLFFKAIMRPIVGLLSASTNGMLRLLGINPKDTPQAVTEEEIRMLVDVGEEKGVIEESQKEMINNIFEFDDIVAADVMTHRTDVVAIDINDSFTSVLKTVMEEGYSRIPVYDDDLDDIKGVLYVKDLLKFVGQDLPKRGVSKLMRKAYFVPESKKCGELFAEMTEKRIQLAIVSDEYGGFAGIVTIEDLLESIVGNMQDEYDDEEEEFEKLNDTTYTIDGVTDIEEVEEELGIKLPQGEYDTVAGMIMSILGRIPEENETPTVEVAGCEFTVESINERRIERVKIVKLPVEEETEEDE
ncbi:MAG: HlyC/CorC family transporter [Clostridia bacterium]|nr:HlyC/CorC family transporter [Clostridia bacterium]